MKNINESKVIIKRNNKDLIWFDFAIKKNSRFNQPYHEKTEGKEGIYLKNSLSISVKDDDYIFSFYGENGVGKSTFCEKICNDNNKTHIKTRDFKNKIESETKLSKFSLETIEYDYKIINIKEYLNLNLNSICSFSKSKIEYLKFSDFFTRDFDKSKLIGELTNEELIVLIKEHYNSKDDLENIKNAPNYKRFIKEEKKINKSIKKWAEKNVKYLSIAGNFSHNDSSVVHKQSPLYYIAKKIDEYTANKSISIEKFLYSYNIFKSEIIEIYENQYIDILNDEIIGDSILHYLKNIFDKIKNLNKNIRFEIKENIKLIDFIKNNFLKDFSLMTHSFIDDIKIKNNYNSLLDMEYQEFFVLKKK